LQSATEAALPQPEGAITHFVIDAKRSTFTVQAFSTGVLSAFGHDPKFAVRDIQGEAQFDPSSPTLESARLNLRIRTDSLEVIDDISAKDKQEIHRQMFDEVLEGERFPEIVYDCSQVTGSGSGGRYWATLNGEFTLHGVTHSLPVSARVVVTADSLRASGEFSVQQSEYGITPVKVAGGAIKLKDEVKCTFDIQARKQE
jgi:polyisoprenoid-binding protein YceI